MESRSAVSSESSTTATSFFRLNNLLSQFIENGAGSKSHAIWTGPENSESRIDGEGGIRPPHCRRTSARRVALEPSTDSHGRRGRDSNPRYRFSPVQRFSKPPP